MSDLSDHWPMYKLRLRHDGLELRFPRDQDLAALANLAAGRIHEVAMMPFSTPWTDATPAVRARSSLQWHWKLRADWSPHDWTLALVAADDGVIVGTQDISGRRFGATREVSTGSWVGADHQGRGVATAMRRAVLHLAFAGLGARWARSGAYLDNTASLRVSEKLGYVADGTEVHAPREIPATMQRLLLTREVWERESASWPAVDMDGLEECLPSFGVVAST